MKPDDREKAHLDYLLADFKALKVEIARRASLQRLALAAYAAVYAGLFPQIASDRVASTLLAAFWVVGALGLLFYVREDLEIKRLACLIRNRIASEAARLVATGPKSLIPSEADQANPRTDKLTRLYAVLFMWSVFFVLPLLLTALVVCRNGGDSRTFGGSIHRLLMLR